MTDKPIYRINEKVIAVDGTETTHVMADTFEDKDALAILDALRFYRLSRPTGKIRRVYFVTRLTEHGEAYVKW